MVNIHEILKKFEISVPAEKKEEFDKLMVENYKTVKEVINLQGKLENMKKNVILTKRSMTLTSNRGTQILKICKLN